MAAPKHFWSRLAKLAIGVLALVPAARIGFLAHGKLVAEGTTAQLMQHAGAATLDDAFIKLTGEAIVEEEELAMVED